MQNNTNNKPEFTLKNNQTKIGLELIANEQIDILQSFKIVSTKLHMFTDK